MQNNYKDLLEKNGILGFVTHGNSMWPFIKNKKTSVIVLKKEDRLSLYDVAFYVRPNGDYVLHRVLKVLDGGYSVRGDSQLDIEFVPENSVIGVLSGYYKGKKYIDCESQDYKDAVISWLNDPNREKKISAYYKKLIFKSRLKRLLTFGRKK